MLTPLQLTAGASILQNTGLGVSANLVTIILTYQTSSLLTPLRQTIANGSVDMGNGSILSSNVILSIESLASNNCPALADSIPQAYANSLSYSNVNFGLSGIVRNMANTDSGNGDLSKFVQAFSTAEAYSNQNNVFLFSAINANTYLANTFTNMNNLITGEVTQVNLATASFGSDLARLGKLINFDNLGDLGSPAALLQTLGRAGSFSPSLLQSLVNAGIPNNVIRNIGSGTAVITDTMQKAMYNAMTTITGSDLEEVLQILEVTTLGINTMADLLNPVKIFPNSYQSLSVATNVGIRGVYLDSAGTVNSNLKYTLPKYLIDTL